MTALKKPELVTVEDYLAGVAPRVRGGSAPQKHGSGGLPVRAGTGHGARGPSGGPEAPRTRDHCATSANFSSASEATSLPTKQRQRVWPMEPRILMTSASMCRVSPGSTGRRHFTLSALMK
jgi:hypothetical protein